MFGPECRCYTKSGSNQSSGSNSMQMLSISSLNTSRYTSKTHANSLSYVIRWMIDETLWSKISVKRGYYIDKVGCNLVDFWNFLKGWHIDHLPQIWECLKDLNFESLWTYFSLNSELRWTWLTLIEIDMTFIL